MESTARLEEIIKYVQSLQNQVGVIKTRLFENEYHNKIFLSFPYRFSFSYISVQLLSTRLAAATTGYEGRLEDLMEAITAASVIQL